MQAFISYSRTDKATVERLRRALEQRNVDVWLPEAQISPGQIVAAEIERAINDSDAVIVVLSPSSSKSEWVSMETSLAISLQRTGGKPLIIPVVAEPPDKVPFFLQHIHWVDLTTEQNFERNVDRIVDAMRQAESVSPARDADQARLHQLSAAKRLLESEKLFHDSKALRTSRYILITSIVAGFLTILAALGFLFLESRQAWSVAGVFIGFVAGIVTAILIRRATDAR
jgi:nucleotide-binding universal stress UspA family protein